MSESVESFASSVTPTYALVLFAFMRVSSISGARLAGAITIVLLAACGDDGTSTADGDVTNDAGGMRDDGGTEAAARPMRMVAAAIPTATAA